MAISSSKFVNVGSSFITTTGSTRDLSGLVLSTGTPLDATTGIGKDYADGDVVSVTVTDLATLFGTETPEYQWAVKYFAYNSPSGSAPRTVKFRKILTSEAVSESATATVPTGQTGVTGATVAAATFGTKVSNVSGTYVFKATVVTEEETTTTTWKLGTTTITPANLLSQYGITVTGTAANGDQIAVVYQAESYSCVEALKKAIDGTESFGTFTFLTGKDTGVSDVAQLKAAALYNKGLNNDYRMVVDVSGTTGATNIYTLYVNNTGGTVGGELYGIGGLTLCLGCSYMTMARLACTDYDGTNTAGCDMFKTATPDSTDEVVTTDSDYAKYTELRINFIGLVKEHGNQWYWYMRGFNMDGIDSACYDNETWFKGEITTALLNLEAASEKIPANEQGLAMVNVNIQGVIDAALKNGTILPNKPISATKRATILTKLGNDAEALAQLLEYGYYVVSEIKENGEEYEIDYNVAYLKGDAVRFINGAHVIL